MEEKVRVMSKFYSVKVMMESVLSDFNFGSSMEQTNHSDVSQRSSQMSWANSTALREVPQELSRMGTRNPFALSCLCSSPPLPLNPVNIP